MSLNIRPAKPDDALIAATLLAETTGEFGVHVLGLGSPELQFKALCLWFEDSANRFSYQVASIAELAGLTAGVLVAFEGRLLNRLTLGCARRIFRAYTPANAFTMIKRNLHLAGQREAEKDEYLIAHLAVAEGFRRQGVGQALIEKATQDARAMNYSKLVLEVEIENYSAVALYHKAGFETVQTFLYKGITASISSPGFYKMLKTL